MLNGGGVPREQLASLGRAELEEAWSELHCLFWLVLQTLPLESFRPGRIDRLKAVKEALAALGGGKPYRGSAAGLGWPGASAGGVTLEGAPAQGGPPPGWTGSALEALHTALDAVVAEYSRKAA